MAAPWEDIRDWQNKKTKQTAHSNALNNAYSNNPPGHAERGQPLTLQQHAATTHFNKERKKIAKDPKQTKLAGMEKQPKWSKQHCHCGNKMKYACVIQCEDCWQKIVDECLERRKQAKQQEAWAPAEGSAAAAAAASGAPTVAAPTWQQEGYPATQVKFCKCGKLIRNKAFNNCWNCSQKETQLKASADQANENLLAAMKREVAEKQRELAKMQLKEADAAFEATEAQLKAGSWGEDAQSD